MGSGHTVNMVNTVKCYVGSNPTSGANARVCQGLSKLNFNQ